jgi:hypothetical protein
MEWETVDLINLLQDKDKRRAVANAVMNLQVPWNALTLLEDELLTSNQHSVPVGLVKNSLTISKCVNLNSYESSQEMYDLIKLSEDTRHPS